MNLYKKVTISIFLVCTSNLIAQDTQPKTTFSLKEAQEYAIKNAYAVKTARADVKIAEKKIFETTTLGLPQVNGEVNFQNFIDIPTQVLPANAFNPMASPTDLVPLRFGTDYNTSAGLTASQLIFDGSYIVALQASRSYALVSKLVLSKTENDVKEAVAQAYYTVIVAEENKKVLQQSLENMNKILKETEAIYKSGFAEEQDVDQLKVSVATLTNSLNRLNKQTDLAYKLLKLQMGIDIDTPITLSDNLSSLIVDNTAETLANAEFKYSDNLDYKLLETQAHLSKLNLRRERYGYLPSVGAFFSHSQNALRNDFDLFNKNKDWFPTTIWGVKITVPIFDSGMKGAKIGQAKQEYQKALTTQKQVEQSLKIQSESAKADFSSALERYNVEKENLTLTEKIYNKTLIKYKEGLASSLELAQAQGQFLSTQANYVNAMLDLLNSKARLEKIMNNK
jgi:outer membrane protein TolC